MVMVMVICGFGDKIIVFRNVYKFVMSVIVFLGVMFIFIYFEIDENFGIFYGIILDFVEKVLKQYFEVKVVFVINLIYFGIFGDFCKIVEIVYLY